MNNRNNLLVFDRYDHHKGFYNDGNPTDPLEKIYYNDFFDSPDDEDFPYFSAYQLLCGSCHLFALSLRKLLGYNVYIIEGINERGFHVFCQINKYKKWYYVDARGITSSFSEFMDIAQTFVTDEYIIRQIDNDDIAEWEDDDYYEEATAFAEAVINKYKECYTLEQ